MNPKVSTSKPALIVFCKANAIKQLAIFGSALRENFSQKAISLAQRQIYNGNEGINEQYVRRTASSGHSQK